MVRGLNVLDGVDRSDGITVRQLLAHTSGIADYFEGRRDRRHDDVRPGAQRWAGLDHR